MSKHLADALGEQAALSRSTVSRICSAIKDQFDVWRSRVLSDVELEYLFLDASHFRYHQGARSEPVMCAWGITSDGKPKLLSLPGVSAESHDAVVDFLRDMTGRGLRSPVLVVTDGSPGLISAVEQAFPTALRQRCLVHRARNTLAKVSKGDQDEVKADFWAIFDDIEQLEGEPAITEASERATKFAGKWRPPYPGAVACVIDDLP